VIRRLLRDERGVMLPIVAMSAVALIGATSLTIDIGRLASRQRDLQAIADVVALDAAGALVGADLPTLVASDFDDSLVDSAERNGVRIDGDPVAGHVVDDPGDFVPSTDPAKGDVNAWRLDGADDTALVAVAGTWDETARSFTPMATPAGPGSTVGAVAVWAHDQVDYVFGVGRALTDRTGIAEALAATGIGMSTTLATVEAHEDVLRALLGELMLVDIDAGAALVGPDGIAGTTITLGELASELGVGSVEELVAGTVALDELLVAEASLLRADGETAAADVLESISTSLTGTTTLSLGDLVTVEEHGGAASALAAELDVLSLLTATALLVGGDPAHALALDASVLGLPASLTVIEAPVYAFGPEGVTVETAQITLTFDRLVSLDTGWLTQEQCLVTAPLLPCVPTLTNALRLTGTGTSTVTVHVADGRTVLDQLACAPEHRALLDVTSSAVTVDAPLAIPLAAEGVLGAVAGGEVSMPASAQSLGSTAEDVPFGPGANPFGTPVHVPGGTTLASFDIGGVQANLTAAVLGVSLTGTNAVGAVSSAMFEDVLVPLNDAVWGLLSQLDVLGLGLAGADVVAFSPTCSLARLTA